MCDKSISIADSVSEGTVSEIRGAVNTIMMTFESSRRIHMRIAATVLPSSQGDFCHLFE